MKNIFKKISMSNVISNTRFSKNPKDHLIMGTNTTYFFLASLGLAGTQLAHEIWQKKLVIWFLQHDPMIFGTGMVGFDVSEHCLHKSTNIFPKI